MFQRQIVVELAAVLLVCPALVHAVDVKLKPIADGSQSQTYTGNGTSSRLNVEYAEGSYASGRRIVMKFDTTWATSYQLRNAKLYMFGGIGSTSSPVLTKVYHYSFDGWTDASVPFPADGSCRYLTEKTLTNKLTADYIGTSQWHAYDIGDSLVSWDQDGYLSIVMRSFNSDIGAGASFVSRNSVTWDGGQGKEPYIVFETWGATTVQNSDFLGVAGALGPAWTQTSGGGVATVVDNPYDSGVDQMVRMLAGSPVTISQVLDTPADPFYVVFDYEWQTTTGQIDVSLTDRDGLKTLVGTLNAPALLEPGMQGAFLRVNDPTLLGLDNATLSLTLDGATGSEAWLDNVEFSNVPEPATLSLLIIGGLALLRRRQR